MRMRKNDKDIVRSKFRWLACGNGRWHRLGRRSPKKPQRPRRTATKLQSDPKLAVQVTTPFKNPNPSTPVNNLHSLSLSTKVFDQPDAIAVDSTIPGKFHLLCYNQNPVGLTIRVRRGTDCRIKLSNDLNKIQTLVMTPTISTASTKRSTGSARPICTRMDYTSARPARPTISSGLTTPRRAMSSFTRSPAITRREHFGIIPTSMGRSRINSRTAFPAR